MNLVSNLKLLFKTVFTTKPKPMNLIKQASDPQNRIISLCEKEGKFYVIGETPLISGLENFVHELPQFFDETEGLKEFNRLVNG
jgi:hypothetical protein